MKIHWRLILFRLKIKPQGFWKDVFNVRYLLYYCIILQYIVTGAIDATDVDIRNSPKTATVVEGEQYELDCTVRPYMPSASISWYRNDQKIATSYPNRDPEIFLSSSRFEAALVSSTDKFNVLVLTIKYIEVSDAVYNYKCAVLVNDEPIWSTVSNLKVTEIPDSKYPVCEPRDHVFNEKSRMQLKCRSEKLDPPVVLKWYKNDKILSATTQILRNSGEMETVYDFEVKYEDANAEFFCIQSSHYIPKLNGNCTIGPILVNFIPRVSIEYRGHKNSSAVVKFNEVNVLICQAKTAHANPTFKWRFSRKLTDDDYSLSPDSRYVTFTAKELHNNLIATCIVTNDLGSGLANITILVIEIRDPTPKPRVVTHPPYIPPEVPPSLVVAIIGICTLFIVIVMSSVLCCLKFYTHRQFINAHMQRQEIYQRHEPSIGCTIAQPEIYFEPKDSISQSTNTSDGTSSTKRSIGIQVLPQVNLELQDIHQQQTLPARYRGRPLPQPGRPSSPMVDCGCSFV